MSEQKITRALQGKVVSDQRDKTIGVRVETQRQHMKYKKIIKRHKDFHAHDENNTARIGDVVEIAECRPISKTKTWTLTRVISRLEVQLTG
jgi:small subunit ribosomal protein S17